MSQLVITIMAIALFAAFLLATVTYLPAWRSEAGLTDDQVRKALPLLEQAFDLATRANDGEAPTPLSTSDGGFSAIFIPLLQYAPPAPLQYTWVYAQHPVDGGRYSGMHYFCLAPTAVTHEGVGRGLYRGVSVFSRDQAVVASSCGASTMEAIPPSWKNAYRAITFYVAYTPGLTR